jgi:16S rRNA (uracil1498-N3)-methyltransferase
VSAPVFQADRAALVAGADVWLEGAAGHHAAAVRRLGRGELLVLTDGAGRVAECRVREVGRDRLGLDVLSAHDEPPPHPRLAVVQALAKGDRGETAVETLTETGVDVVVPWAAARSVARWSGARGERSLDRWRATAREAAKQSRRAWWPQVAELADLDAVGRRVRTAALAVVLHEEASTPLATLDVPSDGEVVLVVGPEGGVAPDELAVLEEAGALACRLGPTVLRTSTAGTAALAVVLARTARWGPG